MIPIAHPKGFADTSRSRLTMAFIAGWIAVTLTLAGAFGLGTEHRADSLLMHLAQVSVCYAICSGLAFLGCFVALRKSWSDALGYILIAAMTLAGIGMAVNLSGYCSFPGTWEMPTFGTASDFSLEWKRIVFHKETGQYLPGTNVGYTAIASFAVGRFGPGVSGLLILNIMMLCGTVALSSGIAVTLLEGNRRRIAVCAAAATAAVASVIWYATTPLKETGATFSFTLFAFAIAKLYKGRLDVAGILAAAAGGFLLMMVKSPLGWFAIAGIVIAATRIEMRKKADATRRLYAAIYLSLIAGAVVVGGNRFRYCSDAALIGAVEPQRESLEFYMAGYETVQRYNTLIPGYFTSTPEKRIAKLPLAAAAQYFPPFPWNFTRDTDEGRFVWYAHLSIFWYLVGGAAIGYLALCLWRRRARGSLGRWALWWMICYLGVAYYSGGTVARYYLPFIPALIPLSLQFVMAARRHLVPKREVAIYCTVYAVALAGALAAAYIFLKG